jgi:uncharacterized protein (DUF433 family)
MIPPGRHEPAETRPSDLGLYSQTEAARYSDIPLSTVRRWLSRNHELDREELASFDDFVSLLFVRALRLRRVRYADIVAAERDLQERTGHLYPFVHEALWVSGRDVLVRVPDEEDAYLSANRRGQLTLPSVTHPERVELPTLVADVRVQLSYVDGRVGSWRPAQRIAARPLVQFGQTCIEGTRVTTKALFEAALAGDDVPTLARLYSTTESDVTRAIAWEQTLAA